ncbi:hypothetical protein L873DRAFT_1849736, partial [Choiromyces venosus 120613-1]
MGERLTLVDKRLTHVDKRLTHVDKKLTLVDNKQNFSQAFALRSTIKMMKLLDGGGNETDKEEIKKFIRDGEELMGCMERGGEGCDVPVLLYRICADNFLKTAQAVISLTPETDEKTYSIPANLGPSLHNTIHVFLSQQKHNVSPMAKKIIPQLLVAPCNCSYSKFAPGDGSFGSQPPGRGRQRCAPLWFDCRVWGWLFGQEDQRKGFQNTSKRYLRHHVWTTMMKYHSWLGNISQRKQL